MNTVVIVPTGLGAEIGGHNGDANPVVKLFGALSDIVITHPNVVNGSDINEMPENCMYVDGYMLDCFFAGEINLKTSKNRNILLAVNGPVGNDTINAVSASRVTLGIDIEIMELVTDLKMAAYYDSCGLATGNVTGWEELIDQVLGREFDALAIATPVDVSHDIAMEYLRNGGVNPWGGVEAKASRLISGSISKPVAHSPVESGVFKGFHEIVDPRMAPEMLSDTYLHSVFKGLHNAPQSCGKNEGLNISEIDFLISASGCWGPAHNAAKKNGVEIITVEENRTILNSYGGLVCDNYLEAAGIVACKSAGILPKYVRRPIK